MDFVHLFSESFSVQLLSFLGLFALSSLFLLRKKVQLVAQISRQSNSLGDVNSKLVEGSEKRKVITDFLDNLPESYLIKTIISEWLSLQQSLSNFQKYDFDIHIDSFLEHYRFDQSTFARNLLLIGLLFTFGSLSFSFVELGEELKRGVNANSFVNEQLIPGVGMALTSTIAAIVVSFFVNWFGAVLDKNINQLHKRLSDFLIIHVHPTFETASEDTYIKKIESVLDGLTQNIRESNQNLDAISRQSIDTLEKLGDGISQFTSSTQEFKSLLREFSQVQDQINEQSKDLETAVGGLKDTVQGISTIFEAEGNVIGDLADAVEGQKTNIDALVEASNNLNTDLTQKFEKLDKGFNERVIQTLEKNSARINKSLETTAEALDKISHELQKELSENKELRSEQVKEMNNTIKSIARDYRNQIESLNKNSIQREEQFEQKADQILAQQQKLIDKTAKYLNATKRRASLLNSIKDLFN
jgi:methyl-accepting chemotaxis protein